MTVTGSGFILPGDPNGCYTTLSVTAGTEQVAVSNITVTSTTQIMAIVTPLVTDPVEGATVSVNNPFIVLIAGSSVAQPTTSGSSSAPADILPVPAIQYDGNTISGAGASTQSAIIGQQVKLTTDTTTPTAAALAALPVPLTFPSGCKGCNSPPYVWAFTGSPITAYTPTPGTPSSGQVLPLNLNLQDETLYWPYTSPGNTPWELTYQYCVDGPGVSNSCSPQASAKFSLTGPVAGTGTMSFDPYSTAVMVADFEPCPGFAGGPWLIYGTGAYGSACDIQGTVPGISFETPTGYQNASGGSFLLVQLISGDSANTYSGPGLDTKFPYMGVEFRRTILRGGPPGPPRVPSLGISLRICS